jgi:hypothetical protein
MSEHRIISNDVQPENSTSSPSPTSTTSSAPRGFKCFVTAPWQQILNSIIPVGYEDEGGFHFGEKAGEDELAT